MQFDIQGITNRAMVAWLLTNDGKFIERYEDEGYVIEIDKKLERELYSFVESEGGTTRKHYPRGN